MKVAKQLKHVAESAIEDGVTRYAIAKGAGVPYKTLSDWLADDRDIAFSTASKLADFFRLVLRPDEKPAKDKVKAPAVPAVDWAAAEPAKKAKAIPMPVKPVLEKAKSIKPDRPTGKNKANRK